MNKKIISLGIAIFLIFNTIGVFAEPVINDRFLFSPDVYEHPNSHDPTQSNSTGINITNKLALTAGNVAIYPTNKAIFQFDAMMTETSDENKAQDKKNGSVLWLNSLSYTEPNKRGNQVIEASFSDSYSDSVPGWSFSAKGSNRTSASNLNVNNLEYNYWYTIRFEYNVLDKKVCVYVLKDDGTIVASAYNLDIKDSRDQTDMPSGGYYFECGYFYDYGRVVGVNLKNFKTMVESVYCTDEPVVTFDSTNNKVYASATVYNDLTEEQQSPVLMLAVYDANGKIVGLNINKTTLTAREAKDSAPGSTEITCDVNVSLKEGYTARAMIIDSLTGRIPLYTSGYEVYTN